MSVRVVMVLLIVAACLRLPASRAVAAPGCAQPNGVSALTAGPHRTVLIGTLDGRLYRSHDGGHCFGPVPAPPLRAAIGVLVVPPRHPSWIIAGTAVNLTLWSVQYHGPGLYRSEDAGNTWVVDTTGLPLHALLPSQLAALPDGTLVLGYGCPLPSFSPCAGGLARSVDGGRTWQPVGPRGWVGQAVVALGTKDFLAAIIAGSGAHVRGQVIRSSDEGRTWHAISVLPGTASDVTTLFSPPWNPSLIVAGYGAARAKPKIARSLDGGRHWTIITRTISSANYGFGLVAAFTALGHRHTLLLSVYSAVYRSVDAGATWTLSSRGLPGYGHMSIEALFTAPDGVIVFAGNANVYTDSSGLLRTVKGEPGLYRSSDGGLTWAPNA